MKGAAVDEVPHTIFGRPDKYEYVNWPTMPPQIIPVKVAVNSKEDKSSA
jgi:hypothetical protein